MSKYKLMEFDKINRNNSCYLKEDKTLTNIINNTKEEVIKVDLSFLQNKIDMNKMNVNRDDIIQYISDEAATELYNVIYHKKGEENG